MPKLLIVDDEPDNIELLARRLSRRGFEVVSATSAVIVDRSWTKVRASLPMTPRTARASTSGSRSGIWPSTMASLSLRAEIPVPYDLLRRSRIPLLRRTGVQFVPFADAARVFDGDVEGWIQSYGLGPMRANCISA